MKSITVTTFLIFIFCGSIAASPLSVVAYVNDSPVEAAELKREMVRYRAVVYNEYAKAFDLSKVKDFWHTDFEGTTPMDSLRNKALKSLIEIKVQQQLLEENRLWSYNTYGELLAALEQENEQRQQKALKKEIIYGPVVYSEQIFFDYKFSNALIVLKNSLAGNKIPVNDSLLLVHFDTLKSEGVYSAEKTFDNFKRQIMDSYIDRVYKRLLAKMVNETKVKTMKIYNEIVV